MNKQLKNLIFIFLGIILVKIILSYFIPSSRALADDYQYLKMSESFFYHFSLVVHNTFSGQLYPLYPILISISHIFKDNNLVYLAIKIINSILSSLIIFPAYYLSKEFLSDKKSFFTAIFISLLPANFSLVSYIMAENLFYSLFLISIYFIYKAFKIKTYRYYFLAGLFTILTLFTRIHGIILILLIFIMIFFEILKKKLNLKYLIFILLILTSLAFWYFSYKDTILNFYIYRYLSLIKFNLLLAFIIKFISYFGFLLIGCGLILMLPLVISFKIKDINLNLFRKIFLITLFISLALAAVHALGSPRYFYNLGGLTLISGRIIGRYIDFCLPLIAILSFVGLDHYFKDKINKNVLKKFTIILTFIMILTTSIILSPLVPLNNVSLTAFGVIRYVIDSLIYNNVSFEFGATLASYLILSLIFVLLPLLNYYLLKKLNYRKIISLLLILLILNIFVSFIVVNYAARTSWYYNSEQRQLALFLNKIDPERSIVLIDERDEGDFVSTVEYDPKPGRNEKALYTGNEQSKYTVLGYWLNDELIIGDVNDTDVDYIISTYNLPYNKIYETKNGIYIYNFD